MAKANDTSSAGNVVAVQADKFNSATLKLEGAAALVTAFGIFAGETERDGGEMPLSGSLISKAMSGIELLIEIARDDLLQREGGAA